MSDKKLIHLCTPFHLWVKTDRIIILTKMMTVSATRISLVIGFPIAKIGARS